MLKYKFPATILLTILLFVSACSPQGGQPPNSETNQETTRAIETQVAIIVASTLTAQRDLADAATATQAALATSTPEFTFTPSFTPTQTYTMTPTFPTVTVSVNTNCRTGPTTAYDRLGVMIVGETAEVVGRSTLSDTMIIKLPSDPAITCWLWAKNATVSGDISRLPIIPVPFTPTPKASATQPVSFNLAYISTDLCMGSYRIKFRITNTGSLTWESDRVSVTDQNISFSNTVTYDNFPYYSSGCVTNGDQNLEAGELGYTTSEGFVANPAGHNMVAVIRVCSQNGLAGTCLEKTITFIP